MCAGGVDVDDLGGGVPGQAGHEHDLAADGDHEAGAGGEEDPVHVDVEILGPAQGLGVVGEGSWGSWR